MKVKKFLEFFLKCAPILLIIQGATFAFEIYDLEGKSRLDLFFLGDILRSLKLNPTLKMLEKFGGMEKKGEKFVNFDQFCKVEI
jgi:hypothetical protein